MCSDTLNPGGELRRCCVDCILDMPEISPSVFIAASYELQGILDRVSVLWHWEVSELPSQFYLIPCSLWTVPFHCLFPEFPGGATPLKIPYIGGLFECCQNINPGVQVPSVSFMNPSTHKLFL